MIEIKYNRTPRPKVNYKEYKSRRHAASGTDYLSYAKKKLKVNPVVETILTIEDLLMETEVNWSISYEPSTKSYSIFIANLSDEEPKPKEDLDKEPVFDTEFIFEKTTSCADLKSYLFHQIDHYGFATVGDLWKYAGYSADDINKHKYGWRYDDIVDAYFDTLPYGGYLLKIAKPKPLT